MKTEYKFIENNLLIQFLRDQDNWESLDAEGYPWETLIRQARHANLLSRIAVFLDRSHLIPRIPPKPRIHLENAIKISEANRRSARWEILDTYNILNPEGVALIILKGCAYIWVKNGASAGRLFGDTDILVMEKQIVSAETALVHKGWVTTKLNNYDQHFYREWMHEIPPLHHLTRHTSLDVHHTIIPPITKTGFTIDAFWEMAVEDKNHPNLFTLSLMDMILHSATHLFHEGEFPNGLRDISDLHCLLQEFRGLGNQWEDLLDRADKLDLSAYLFYALRYSRIILNTDIPDSVIEQASINSKFGRLHNWFMDTMFLRALIPSHSTSKITGSDFCRWLLFIRSHWIRMPFRVLVPHLIRKSLKKE